MAETNLFGEITDDLDKAEEYLKVKDALKTLRSELKDIMESLDSYIELEKIMKKVRELREDIKENETIKELTEKIHTLKERADLLKELIRIDMIDHGQEELEKKDRILKLQNILRDLKNKKSTYHPDQLKMDIEKSVAASNQDK